jgi:PAS domain S-box-containing protein
VTGLRGRVVAASILLAGVVGGIFAVLLVAIAEERDSSDAARHSEQVLAAANRLERRVIDLETGLRGLLLTRNERFLGPFRSAQAAVPAEAGHLRRLVAGNPEQAARAKALSDSIDSYLKDYIVPQVLRGHVRPGAARSVAITGEGKRRTDDLREQFGQFIAAESMLADDRRGSADDQARTAILLGILGLVISVALLLAFCGYLAFAVVRPIGRVAGGARRVAAGDLSARVDERGAAELGELARTFNVMATSLEENRDELESQNAELEAQQGELEHAVEQLAEEKRQVEVLHRFGAQLQEHAELEPLARAALAELCELSNSEIGALYARGRDERTRDGATLLAARGVRPDRLAPRLEAGDGAAGRAMAERRTVAAGYGETGLRVPAYGDDVAVRVELHVPLIQSDRHVGVVSLGRVRDQPFSDDDIATIQYLAAQAAIALSNARALQVARHRARINRAVLDTADEAYIAMDYDAQVTAWNPASERLFGWRGEEAMGRPVAELVVPERDRAVVQDELQRFHRTGKSRLVGRPVDVTAMRRDGTELPVEMTISPLNLDGRWMFNVFVHDISARRRSQLHLQAQNAVVRVLAEAATADEAIPRLLAALGETLRWQLGAFWTVDEHAERLWLEAGWSVAGLDRSRWETASSEVVLNRGQGVPGMAWESGEVTWIEDVGRTEGLLRARAARDLGLRAMVSVPVRSGTTTIGVLELLSVEPRPRDDQLVALMTYLGQQIGQYLDRKASEREAEILKDQFFALVSHELRTPLTSIIGYLELVLEDPEHLAANQRRFLGVVDRNARRLLRLVGDLLFVAHVEAGRLALEMGDVDLPTLTREAVEAARPRAEGKDLALSAKVDAVPLMAGDRDRLAQVLDNLVSNAVKFTPEGGRVAVRLAARDGQAVVEVQDTGVGIPAAEQDRLFERFFRASTATERAIPGVGLGLTIAKAIVEAHGGRLGFHSVEGAGTTFSVRLPMRPPPRTRPAPDRIQPGVSL